MMARRHPRERGVALLLVLWVFMTLGVLALDFSRYMRDDAMSAVNFAEETRGYYLALAGMHRALFYATRDLEQKTAGRLVPGGPQPAPLEAPNEFAVPVDGGWHDGTFAGGTYRVRMADQEARISLNSNATEVILPIVVRNLLRGGNATTGIDRRTQAESDSIVNAILDWRDHDNRPREPGGAESEYYLSLRPPYRAKNSLFDSPEELLLVKGVTPALFYGRPGQPGLRDIVTAYRFCRSPSLYVRTMPPAVLQVLLGLSAEDAADLVAQRDAEPESVAPVLQNQIVAAEPTLAPFVRMDAHEPRMVFIEARADTRSERNQSAVAGLVELPGANSNTDELRVHLWFDRAPWSGTMPAPPGSEELS